jgi:hypothetical protein
VPQRTKWILERFRPDLLVASVDAELRAAATIRLVGATPILLPVGLALSTYAARAPDRAYAEGVVSA